MTTLAYPLTALLLVVTPACLVESPEPTPEVTGTWRTIDGSITWTFGTAGQLVVVEPTESPSSQFLADGYAIEGDRMQFAVDGEYLLDVGFVVTHDRLLVGTLAPRGSVDGVVGMWEGTAVLAGRTEVTSLELMTDGAVSKVHEARFERGTWRAIGETLRLEFPDVTERWYPLGDRAIGDLLFTHVAE